MRLIGSDDEQLFHTVTIAARLGKANRIVDRLAAAYDENWEDPETGFRYALALIAVLQVSSDDLAKHAGYTQSMEALDDVLASSPDHWLARYCRARLRAVIPTSYGNLREYLGGEQGKALADVEELLRGQEAVAWQPYFAAAYVLAAQVYAGQGDEAGAAKRLGEAVDRPRAALRYAALGSLLSEPFLTLYHGGARQLAGAVAPLMADLFPDNPAVAAALRAAAAR